MYNISLLLKVELFMCTDFTRVFQNKISASSEFKTFSVKITKTISEQHILCKKNRRPHATKISTFSNGNNNNL